MKSSKYIKKKKGIRYIAKALVRYQKKKYKNYFQALPDARKFYDNIKSSGETVKLSTIWKYSRTHRPKIIPIGPKEIPPEISSELLSVVNYWGLIDFPTEILKNTNEVFFVSSLFNPGIDEIQGGELLSYENSFSSYVNYINDIRSNTVTDAPIGSDYPEWYVTCTPVYKNNEKDRWESEIIEVNSAGEVAEYGYDQSNIKEVEFEPKPSITPRKPIDKPSIKKAPSKKVSKATMKEVKEIISDLRSDLSKGIISKDQYFELVKGLFGMLNPNKL